MNVLIESLLHEHVVCLLVRWTHTWKSLPNRQNLILVMLFVYRAAKLVGTEVSVLICSFSEKL